MRKHVITIILIIAIGVTANAQQYPGTKFCTDPIPHSAIFMYTRWLNAGSVYHFSTSGTSGWFLQNGRPDPVMILIDNLTERIVSYNDDYIGLDSDIIFSPSTSGSYRLIVHSYATSDAGFTNILFNVVGAPPTTLATNTKFGGTHVRTDWMPGIKFDTAGGTGDTVLLLFTGTSIGSHLLINDDRYLINGNPDSNRDFGSLMNNLHSSITPPAFSLHGGMSDNISTKAIVGSFSVYSEGQTTLCQAFRSWMSPVLSPPQGPPKPAPVPNTPEMSQYLSEYEKLKNKLTQMTPDERDRAILDLQRRILPEAQIRTFAAQVSYPTATYVRAQQEYLARVMEKEKELANLDHEKRAAALAVLKEETVGRALLKIEPDYGLDFDKPPIVQPLKKP